MTIRLLLASICCCTALLLNGCATPEQKTKPVINATQLNSPKLSYVLRGRNYSFAIYNNEHRLLTHPIDDLMVEMKWRHITGNNPITDVYVISHGWNYTLSTAIANYHNYIKLIDKFIKENGKKSTSFEPYFIFVTWTSSVRPTTDLVKGVLPFGIDSAVEPLTSLIDKVPLHLFTGWKQSLNATHNALGLHYPDYYLNKKWEWGVENYGYKDTNLIQDADNLMGNPLPLSALIHKLVELKLAPTLTETEDEYCKIKIENDRIKFDRFDPESDKCVSLKKTKLHMVGHSYGAKLVTIASMEALRRWMLESITNRDENSEKYFNDTGHKSLNAEQEISELFFNDKELDSSAKELKKFYLKNQEIPIESLVLFNPAFHPGELSYPVNPNWTAPTETLKFIPRKAIVYTTHDYANGALFGMRDAILNTRTNQRIQQYWSDKKSNLLDQQPKQQQETTNIIDQIPAFMLNKTSEAILGPMHIGYNVIATQTGQAVYSVINLASDFLHHIKTGTLDGHFIPITDLSPQSFGKGMVNAIDFFLPIKLTRLLNPEGGWFKGKWFPSFHLRDEVDQGLFRISKPGLGKTGLNHLAAGRLKGLNLWGLSNYMLDKPFGKPKCLEKDKKDCLDISINDATKEPFAPNIDAETFRKLSEKEVIPGCIPDFEQAELLWQREKFYSFDASQVYNSDTTILVGAHSDLRKSEGVDTKSGKPEKRDHTFNFILHFTKTNFNEELKK